MKQFLTVSAGIALAACVSAQALIKSQPKVIFNRDGSTYRSCIDHFKTKTLLQLIADRDERMKGQPKPVVHPHPSDNGTIRKPTNPADRTHADIKDESLQADFGTLNVASTILNFDASTSTQGGYPEDPNGMIGSNYYVETINSDFAVYNKTTGAAVVPTTDLTGVFPSTGDDGDPVVKYDKMADRWIITEFDDQGTGNVLWSMFAVSVTNDPTGSYYEYIFEPDPSLAIMDYPKYTIWSDGYYETCNCQFNSGYNGDVMCYQRDSMLVGNNAGVIVMPWDNGPYAEGCGGNFFCAMTLDCDGTLPPYGSPEYLLYYWDGSWGCGGVDSLCVEQIKVNWTSGTGTINANYQHLNTTAFNSNFPADFDANIPQPGNNTSNYLASQDGFVNYRIPYLQWSSYNSAVLQFPVNVGSLSAPVSGVRWFELHQDTTTKKWSIYQQSTYAPSGGISRWDASIAMDQNGSIGLAYSVSDPTSTYPGLRYTGRRSCDALNTMTVSEVTAVSGNTLSNTPQGNGMRWGDYSNLSVDPIDGITFWHCGMYAENGASFGENIASRLFTFQIAPCLTSVPSEPIVKAQLYAYQNGNILEIKGTDLPTGQRVVVELFDVNGKKLMNNVAYTSVDNLETSFNVAQLAKAIYLVRIGNDNFQRVVKVDIQ